ncbi:MAG: alpha/beta hydrolase [Gammaproteobacteria bacterium]|nr:alpha/beta hydrolase [Gammaproteobacteria bacterium]
MSSKTSKLVRSVTSAYVRRIDVANVDVAKVRHLWDRLGKFLMTAIGVKIRKDRINGLYAEWFDPKQYTKGKLILYLHGGAYIVGGCDMHRQMVSHLARAANVQVLLPEYRLAPEHKYPAGLEDAIGIYRSLLNDGWQASDIMLAGDSAGGGLSVATLLALRDAGDELPAGAVLMSPFLDVTASGETMQTRAAQDPWFHPEHVPVIAEYYCEEHQRRDAYVSPVFANAEGLPPIYIQVGNDEILLSDSTRFAENVRQAGGDVELDIWPDMWHVFQFFVNKMPESGRAIAKIGAYVQSRLA